MKCTLIVCNYYLLLFWNLYTVMSSHRDPSDLPMSVTCARVTLHFVQVLLPIREKLATKFFLLFAYCLKSGFISAYSWNNATFSWLNFRRLIWKNSQYRWKYRTVKAYLQTFQPSKLLPLSTLECYSNFQVTPL